MANGRKIVFTKRVNDSINNESTIPYCAAVVMFRK